ncbi:MAG: hypothetical protein Q7R83_01540 [bacterium]|nr:hypothetical protein [bacterium]
MIGSLSGIGRLAVGLPMYAYRNEDVMEEKRAGKKFQFLHYVERTGFRLEIVEDGMWMLDVESEVRQEASKPWHPKEFALFGVGVTPLFILSQQESATAETQSWRHFMKERIIRPEPFGAILYETNQGGKIVARSVVLARQIHKGELGLEPDLKELFSQAFGSNADVCGWARLDDVANVLDMTRRRLITTFASFSGSAAGSDGVRLLRTVDPYPSWGGDINGTQVPLEHLDHLLALSGYLWIRTQMARAAITLHHFKYDLSKLR